MMEELEKDEFTTCLVEYFTKQSKTSHQDSKAKKMSEQRKVPLKVKRELNKLAGNFRFRCSIGNSMYSNNKKYFFKGF